jgi:hypothetical protein
VKRSLQNGELILNIKDNYTFFLSVFQDMILLFTPGWPQTHDPPAFSSWVQLQHAPQHSVKKNYTIKIHFLFYLSYALFTATAIFPFLYQLDWCHTFSVSICTWLSLDVHIPTSVNAQVPQIKWHSICIWSMSLLLFKWPLDYLQWLIQCKCYINSL